MLFIILLLLGCSTSTQESADPLPNAELVQLDIVEGYAATVLPYSFNRPTQFVVEENILWVAQLAGGENAERGEVLRVNLSTGEQTVVLEGLDKPTGLAIIGPTIYVADRDSILSFDTSVPDGVIEIILENLPNNGRSNGTLTVTPSGEILYETSGNRRDADSGKLWALNPVDGSVRELASGLKGAYAHAVGPSGQIWMTEVADGSLQGTPYPDEINVLQEGANYGWPTCYGRELAGTDCEGVKTAITTFSAGSTPTGIAYSPFGDPSLFVALWVSGEVVRVESISGRTEPFIQNLGNPQHLLALDDGSLLVSDYAAGKIYQIKQS